MTALAAGVSPTYHHHPLTVTPATISARVAATHGRLVDLQSYDTSSGRRFLAVMVANVGADAKA
jgi:hypothetical protein